MKREQRRNIMKKCAVCGLCEAVLLLALVRGGLG